MILIDFGNTRLKWQVRVPGGEIRSRGAGVHGRGAQLPALVAGMGREVEDPQAVWIASVVGPALEAALVHEVGRWPFAPSRLVFIRAESTRCGVRSGYGDPSRLGADRWAGLIGAWRRTRRATFILSLGTAITLDVLDGKGLHRGGLIVPGQRSLLHALATSTATLPEVSAPGRRALGQDTETGMANGCRLMVEGFIREAEASIGRALALDPVRIVTGGDAGTLDPDLLAHWQPEPDLVFDGLQALAEES